MRFNFLIALFFVFFLSGFSTTITATETNRPKEFRGIWVITWEIYRKDGRTLVGDELKNRIQEILDNVKMAGLNAVIWQVRQSGTAYYPSNQEPWGKYLDNASPGFDPVEYALAQAKKRGLEFHAWFNSLESGSNAPGTPAAKHPEWIARDKNGTPLPKSFALSPGIAEVRQYFAEVIYDFVSKYAVDGVHLDYIRWNEHRWIDFNQKSNSTFFQVDSIDLEQEDSPDELKAVPEAFGDFVYDSEHPATMNSPADNLSWEEWRRRSVTETVAGVRKAINLARPSTLLSVAAIGKYNWGGWNGYHAVFQDAVLWLNTGLIDQIMAMNYHALTGEQLSSNLHTAGKNSWMTYLGPAIQAGRKYSAGLGSLMLRTRDLWKNHSELMSSARSTPNLYGVQFFSYGDWEKQNYFKQAKLELQFD